MDRELLIYLHLKLNQNLLIIQFFGIMIATTEILSLKDAVYLYQSWFILTKFFSGFYLWFDLNIKSKYLIKLKKKIWTLLKYL